MVVQVNDFISKDDFYNPENWPNGELPQSHTCQQATVSGTADAPKFLDANAAAYGQINSLTIGDYATVKVTAQSSDDAAGAVFSALNFEIASTGTLIIDTPAPIDLAGFNEISGTLTIMNNPGNVALNYNRLSGPGTLNLINSTLGSEANPVRA